MLEYRNVRIPSQSSSSSVCDVPLLRKDLSQIPPLVPVLCNSLPGNRFCRDHKFVSPSYSWSPPCSFSVDPLPFGCQLCPSFIVHASYVTGPSPFDRFGGCDNISNFTDPNVCFSVSPTVPSHHSLHASLGCL